MCEARAMPKRLVAKLHDAATCEVLAEHEVSSACWDATAANGKGVWNLNKVWEETHEVAGSGVQGSYWIELTEE